MWYRVFSMIDLSVPPEQIQGYLASIGVDALLHVKGDTLGWTECRVELDKRSLTIERYLTEADDLRDELNSWAGWLETQSHEPNHQMLMERVIGAMQLFTLQMTRPDQSELCTGLMFFLAAHTHGILQIDKSGFFDETGALLLQEQ
jgi:hypothetical protein